MVANGTAQPAEVVKRLVWTFKGDKLFVRGNFDDDRDEECTYRLDPKQKPKQLDVMPLKQEKTFLGIYDVKGDTLTLCLRHNSSKEGRPTEFVSKAGAKVLLLVLERKKH